TIHPTHGSTYGPFGITAMVASGPYSVRHSATAASTDAAGSTRQRRSVSGDRPSLTTFTLQRAVTLENITSCHSSISQNAATVSESGRGEPCFRMKGLVDNISWNS